MKTEYDKIGLDYREKPIIIDPPITDPEGLRSHMETYLTILMAQQILRELPETVCLIGGIAAACHVGKVYREHGDVDLAVPAEFYYDELQQRPDLLSWSGDDVFTLLRTTVPGENTGGRPVKIDFFVYGRDGISHEIEGIRRNVPLLGSYPISATEILLAGIPLRVAPKQIIVGLKAIDSSPKGRLDFAKLTSR